MGKSRNRSEVERQTERDVMPIEKIQETMQKHKGLKLVDVKCKDCEKEFKWYLGTKRCTACNTIFRRRFYVKKNNYPLTPMVIFNSKGLIIGEVERPCEIKKWYLENTKIKEPRLKGAQSLRHHLEATNNLGNIAVKFICYWVMFKKDYSLEKAIEHINKPSHLLGVKRNTVRSPEFIAKVLAVFNDNRMAKEIAVDCGMSREWVAHIKTGWFYSEITGKKYEKIYNIAGV